MRNVRVEAVVVGAGLSGVLRVKIRRDEAEDVIDVPAQKLPPPLRIPNSGFVAVLKGRDFVAIEANGAAWLEIQSKIRTVLNRNWDPIGVGHVATDEYDGYIEEIYFMLKSGSSDQAIANALGTIETQWMGLAPTPMTRLLGVAAKLRALSLPSIDTAG